LNKSPLPVVLILTNARARLQGCGQETAAYLGVGVKTLDEPRTETVHICAHI
jgi:hypothetical protein